MRKYMLFLMMTAFFHVSGLSMSVSAQDYQIKMAIYKNYTYLIYYPANYASDRSEWPLFVYLHGAGERGKDINRVKPAVPAQFAEGRFVIIAPQCPSGQHWSSAAVHGLIQDFMKKQRIDRKRVYLTGYSMGGYGTWKTACGYPKTFAAIAPIAGGGSTSAVKKLKDVPVWAFHGKKDHIVPFSESDRMVKALIKAGGNVKFTVLPNEGHAVWDDAYMNPDLSTWILQQRKR